MTDDVPFHARLAPSSPWPGLRRYSIKLSTYGYTVPHVAVKLRSCNLYLHDEGVLGFDAAAVPNAKLRAVETLPYDKAKKPPRRKASDSEQHTKPLPCCAPPVASGFGFLFCFHCHRKWSNISSTSYPNIEAASKVARTRQAQ